MCGADESPLVRRAGAAILPTAVVCAIALAADSAGQTAGRHVQTTLRAVTIAPSRDGAMVVIEAGGPLPEPVSGFAPSPPRIYLDLSDVLPGQAIPAAQNPMVTRVRVAEHSASPLVTRVVIDLARATPYRIDASDRQRGRIVIMLGVGDRPAVSLPQTALPSPAPKTPSGGQAPPSSQTASRGPALTNAQVPEAPPARRSASVENTYDLRVSAALVRLHAMRPLLESIDRSLESLPANLELAVNEFEAIGKVLAAIKAPRSREGTHALLQRTCTMGERAVRMRQGGALANDPAAVPNAASAAAGALMMLDRANKELAGEK